MVVRSLRRRSARSRSLRSTCPRCFSISWTQSDVEETQYVASLMPLAEQLPHGASMSEAVPAVVDEIWRFVGVDPPMPDLDTVLATVLFTDIVEAPRSSPLLEVMPGRS
jgi:hypothetical protein